MLNLVSDLIFFSVCVEVHQKTHHHHIRNKCGTAVTHKGQRKTDHRHQSHRHAGIDDYVCSENAGHADC